MKLNELLGNPGSHAKRIRPGRGIGCTKGKTCGRGEKGQKSRTGVRMKNFEGGQKPIFMVIGRKGFNNKWRTIFETVTIAQIQKLFDAKKISNEITLETLLSAHAIKNPKGELKILGTGDVTTSFEVKCFGITKSAQEKIEKAGGKVEILTAPKNSNYREPTKRK